MKKRIVSALAILLISGSVALAQSQAGNKKDIPLVSKKAPGSSEDKKANAKVDPSSSNAKPTKIPEGEKGSTHEKVNSRDREHLCGSAWLYSGSFKFRWLGGLPCHSD